MGRSFVVRTEDSSKRESKIATEGLFRTTEKLPRSEQGGEFPRRKQRAISLGARTDRGTELAQRGMEFTEEQRRRSFVFENVAQVPYAEGISLGHPWGP